MWHLNVKVHRGLRFKGDLSYIAPSRTLDWPWGWLILLVISPALHSVNIKYASTRSVFEMFSPVHAIAFLAIPYGACEMHDIIVFEMTSVSYGALPGSKFNPANLSKLVNLIYQKLYLYSPRNDTQFRVGDHFGGCTYSPSKGLNLSKNRLNSYNTLIWHYINFFTLSYLIHSPFLRKR